MAERNRVLPLHVHTGFSFHEGASMPEALVREAVRQGLPALGFTDRNRVSGLIQAHKAAKKAGVDAVLGLCLDDCHDRDRSVLLWAEGARGYGTLCELSSARQLEAEFSLQHSLMRDLPGVVAATSDPELLRDLREVLPPGQLYALLPRFRGRAERKRAVKAFEGAKELHLPLVAAGAVHATKPSELPTAQLLRAIGHRNILLKTPPPANGGYGVLEDHREIERLYSGVGDALVNTWRIAERCRVDLKLGKLKFPQPDLPPGRKTFDELRKRAEDGARLRYGPALPQPVQERLAYELGVIDHLGFTGYMLVVHDIARRAWGRGVRTLGRGSAANSIVCYCLRLTDICPIKHDLYFERFLNPERTSPPDVDLDFSWRDRDEILHGVYDMFGHDRVAMIATTVTYGPRAALHETALAHGLPEDEISRITKRIPHFTKLDSLTELPAKEPACAHLPLDRSPWREIALQADGLLGLPRHLSIHAGGIVITPDPLTRWTALERARKGFVICQYDMYSVEELGLVKIDLLSQRALGVLKDSLSMIQTNDDVEVNIEDTETVFSDPKTRELLKTGNTLGVFYVESPGMIALLQKLKCDHFELLVAASSVIRPGVSESGMMQQYVERVRDPAKAEYLHPVMRRLLSETHGVMIYQEDVIKVAHHVAGLPLGRADLLRRAMSGKYRSREEMARLSEEFVRGCQDRGVEEKTAREIWRQIESFAGYSFCKAHSASFAVLSMQLAYIKTHHPAEFFAAVLANRGGYYSQATYVAEARRAGIQVLLPDVNRSDREHWGAENSIQLGLNSIGTLSDKTLERILQTRGDEGEFTHIGEFIRRAQPARDEIEAMIACGALDALGANRPTMLRNVRAGFDAYRDAPGPLAPDSEDVFGGLSPAKDWTEDEKYLQERACMGFSPGRHPLALLDLSWSGTVPARRLLHHEGHTITMIGWAYSHKTILTRRAREKMLFLSLEDLTGTFEATLFPRVYRRYADILQGHGPFRIHGTVEEDHGVHTLVAKHLEKLPSLSLSKGR